MLKLAVEMTASPPIESEMDDGPFLERLFSYPDECCFNWMYLG